MTLGRYHRQTLLPDVGDAGQQRLARAHAVVVGCGALGCHASDLLVRAGVGRVTIIDRDVVERTNLQRQSLFTEEDADRALPKAEAAESRLRSVNAEVRVDGIVADLDPLNAERLVLADDAPGVILDGTDNFETRYLLNDVGVKHRLPLAYAGVVAARATAFTVRPGEGACLRCLDPDRPGPGAAPTCDTAGVFGPAVAIVAGYQASEALKLLLGLHDRLAGSLLEFDLWTNRRHRLDLAEARDTGCPCCALGKYEFLDERPAEARTLCGREAVQVRPASVGSIGLDALQDRWATLGPVERSATSVRVRVGEYSLTLFSDGRAIVDGTDDEAEARSMYARYVGM